MRTRRGRRNATRLARGLGWFSIGLGAMEVLAPRATARLLGVPDRSGLIAGYGLREIATGLGILTARDPAPWVWGRVAGDGLDLGTVATGLDRRNPYRENAAASLFALAGIAALDVACAMALGGQGRHPRAAFRGYEARSGLPKPPEQMRGAARDFEVPRDFRTPEALRPWTRAA